MSVASYLSLFRSGELRHRVRAAWARLSPCVACPQVCQAKRLEGEEGFCQIADKVWVASYGPHFGEEDVLRGWRGSGTVFFSGCNMRCVYCQNWDISQVRVGQALEPEELGDIFLEIQDMGCHNLNLVTPSHVIPQILRALEYAVARGFSLPIVYNTSAYDSVPMLRLLEGIVDIYMPDIKYSDDRIAEAHSGVRHYWRVATRAIREMHRQVGDLVVDKRGLAVRGLLVRHLVLPHGLAGTRRCLEFLAHEISRDTYLNLMDQYRPEYRAREFPELARPITREEYLEAVRIARALGFHRGIPFEEPARRIVILPWR